MNFAKEFERFSNAILQDMNLLVYVNDKGDLMLKIFNVMELDFDGDIHVNKHFNLSREIDNEIGSTLNDSSDDAEIISALRKIAGCTDKQWLIARFNGAQEALRDALEGNSLPEDAKPVILRLLKKFEARSQKAHEMEE